MIEPTPARAALTMLDPDEQSLYRDLLEAAIAPAVRLEQERVRQSAVEHALRTFLKSS